MCHIHFGPRNVPVSYVLQKWSCSALSEGLLTFSQHNPQLEVSKSVSSTSCHGGQDFSLESLYCRLFLYFQLLFFSFWKFSGIALWEKHEMHAAETPISREMVPPGPSICHRFQADRKVHLTELSFLVLSPRRSAVPTHFQPTSPTSDVLYIGLTVGPTVMSDSPSQKYLQRWKCSQKSCRYIKQGHGLGVAFSGAGIGNNFFPNRKPEKPGNYLNQSHQELAGKENDSPQPPKDGCFLMSKCCIISTSQHVPLKEPLPQKRGCGLLSHAAAVFLALRILTGWCLNVSEFHRE